MVDLWRDFWVRENGTGQQAAQLHESYMMMMMIMKLNKTTGFEELLKLNKQSRCIDF